jgi:SAM-dependent methyltransferase
MVERLSLEDGSLFASHAEFIQQYEFARSHCTDKRVLDAGCGSGYGSYYLAREGARSVVGVDVSSDAITEACKTYRRENLSFQIGDLEALQTDGFDVIVNIGALPHLKNPDKFLDAIPDVLVTSTPNIPNPNAYQFHHHFFSEQTFKSLLDRHFSSVELVGQWLTADGRLRKQRGREMFEQMVEHYYNPAARVGRIIKRAFGKSLAEPPQANFGADSYGGDHIISPLDDPPFSWPPTTFLAVCRS